MRLGYLLLTFLGPSLGTAWSGSSERSGVEIMTIGVPEAWTPAREQDAVSFAFRRQDVALL